MRWSLCHSQRRNWTQFLRIPRQTLPWDHMGSPWLFSSGFALGTMDISRLNFRILSLISKVAGVDSIKEGRMAERGERGSNDEGGQSQSTDGVDELLSVLDDGAGRGHSREVDDLVRALTSASYTGESHSGEAGGAGT